jgi:hypothetical protein
VWGRATQKVPGKFRQKGVVLIARCASRADTVLRPEALTCHPQRLGPWRFGS